jgi:hypothetical protein
MALNKIRHRDSKSDIVTTKHGFCNKKTICIHLQMAFIIT